MPEFRLLNFLLNRIYRFRDASAAHLQPPAAHPVGCYDESSYYAGHKKLITVGSRLPH